MGLLYPIAVLALLLAAALTVVAAVMSAKRASGIPGYQMIAVASTLVMPILLIRVHPSQPVDFLLDGILSLSGMVCIAGAIVCMGLSVARSYNPLLLLSAVSWGFFSTMAIRVVVLFAQQS